MPGDQHQDTARGELEAEEYADCAVLQEEWRGIAQGDIAGVEDTAEYEGKYGQTREERGH